MVDPVRFGQRVARMNVTSDGKSYMILVKDTGTFALVRSALSDHGASASAWVSLDNGSGPQWVPFTSLM